jgi:hypothetical protein
MPERPFKLIKLKKTPAGSGRAFPSQINTAQAAIAFVNHSMPKRGPNCIGGWQHRP